jgi:Uma2 family endonuclease
MSVATLDREELAGELYEVDLVPDGYEFIDGMLLEVEPMSIYSSQVANRLNRLIERNAEVRKIGMTHWDTFFKVPFPGDPRRVCKPDLAFVTYGRWPENRPLPYSGNAIDVVPELVVEVVSPSDFGEAVITKARQYLKAGVSAVWLVYPESMQIHCYQQHNRVTVFTEDDTLDGAPVLAGFSVPVRELFPPLQGDELKESLDDLSSA